MQDNSKYPGAVIKERNFQFSAANLDIREKPWKRAWLTHQHESTSLSQRPKILTRMEEQRMAPQIANQLNDVLKITPVLTFNSVREALKQLPELIRLGKLDGRAFVTQLLTRILRHSEGRKENELLDDVRLLLDAGADINVGEGRDDIPLHAAFEHDHFMVARLLLERGANPNARTRHGYTAVSPAAWAAVRHNDSKIVAMVLDAGADVNVVVSGRTIVDDILEQSMCFRPDGRGRAGKIADFLRQRGATAPWTDDPDRARKDAEFRRRMAPVMKMFERAR